MAAITTDRTTAGFIPRGFVFGMGSTAQTATNNLNTDVDQKHGTKGLELVIYHVTGIDDGETVTIEHPVIACAFQAEDASDDIVACWPAIAATATGNRARKSTTVTFETAASAAAGWLWTLQRT